MEEKIKIKPLTKQQIIISLDRLTRFKFTEDKYLRVFKEILTSNLITPKFKKSQLNDMSYQMLREFAENIFKFSLESLNLLGSNDFSVNKKLLEYEKSVFKFDENAEELLKNKIDYKAAATLLDETFAEEIYNGEGLPLNLKWLKSLISTDYQCSKRNDLGLKFPIKSVLIVEGITEEILLPKFAKICGCDFNKLGINIISAGGKNQVVKLFYQFADNLKLPIFVLLDNDAKENYEEIAHKMRDFDKVHILECGEFEDTLPLNLIKRTLNTHPKFFSSVVLNDLRGNSPMTQILEEIFRQRGLEFKKSEFAFLVAGKVLNEGDISQEIEAIISQLVKIA